MTLAIARPALDGLWLADALRAGIYRLNRHAEHINRINVFPVADGDTGTNMSMTLGSVLVALDRERLEHAGAILVRVADAALDGARGNSGAILAQFFHGLGDSAGHLPQLTTLEFASAVSSGAAYARDAVTRPREGTLLTVLSEFARETMRLTAAGSATDFRSLFATAMLRMRTSLAGTREQLEELRSAGVVDAGAMGLIELLEGMTDYLETGEL